MQEIRVTRTARKHRVGTTHILEAMIDAGEPTSSGNALIYVGTDSRGEELEIVAVPDNRRDGRLAVIHAMPTKYRKKE